jgi:phosphoribosylformylglycinamidine synthase subunit PurL
VHGLVAGVPPPLDFAREKAVQRAVRDCIRASLTKVAHDCSDGGLGVALAEMCFANDLGCKVSLKSALRADALLFGEDASRIVISYSPSAFARVSELCKKAGAELLEIGEVSGTALIVDGLLEAPVAALKDAWSTAIPKLVGA